MTAVREECVFPYHVVSQNEGNRVLSTSHNLLPEAVIRTWQMITKVSRRSKTDQNVLEKIKDKTFAIRIVINGFQCTIELHFFKFSKTFSVKDNSYYKHLCPFLGQHGVLCYI